MIRRNLLAAAFVLFGTALSGCAVNGGGYYVRNGPPPPRYGVVGAAPGPGYVWTEGSWDWRGGTWVWMQGRWMRPPRGRAAWVAPAWHQEGRRWRRHQGYWR